MIGTIRAGVGSPGKLWTGDLPVAGPAVVSIIERVCPCGASTRKFRAAPIVIEPDAERLVLAARAADFPVVLVATGGVGSLVGTNSYPAEVQSETRRAGLVCWNWSGRVGGYVLVAPVAVAGGYVAKTDLPPARPGYVWLHTYAGSTLSEWVLLREDLSSHAVPVVSLPGTCPPCRERAEKAEAALVPVASGDTAPYGNWGERPGYWVSRPVGSRAAVLTVYGEGAALVCETGCFRGTLDALEARVAEVHGDSQHGRDYRAVIAAARAAFAAAQEQTP